MDPSQNAPCEFTQYAYSLDLSAEKEQKDLAVAIQASFNYISKCSKTIFINSESIDKLRHIVFDTKTHSIIPRPTESSFSAWIPSRAWTLLGYEEEVEGPKNLEGMMTFIAEKLAELVKLRFGSSREDTFEKYLVCNYQSIHLGLTSLKEYYRRSAGILPNVNGEKILGRCLDLHETITASAAILANYNSEDFFRLSGKFLNRSKIYQLLTLETNAPINYMMSIGKGTSEKPYIEKILKERRGFQFIVACLKLENKSRQEILLPLIYLLEKAYDNRYQLINLPLQDFYLQILKNKLFEEVHANVVAQILKKDLNSGSVSQNQKESKPKLEALNYIHIKIAEIKKKPLSEVQKEEELNHLLEEIFDSLREYSPFTQLFNFALVFSDQTTAEDNPGLPFKELGSWQIRQFVTKVILAFDDLGKVNLNDSACRKKLLECSELISEIS